MRLLAIHAHPDDESSKGAATMAKYRSLGAQVKVVTCTGGERGDILNSQFQLKPGQTIGQVRQEEMARARDILDIEQEFLGYEDSGLPGYGEKVPTGSFADQDIYEVAAKLIAVIRDFKPHVIISYDPDGGYPHPDHIQTHKAAQLAWEYSADLRKFPGGQPWQISKFYYFVHFHFDFFEAIIDGMQSKGLHHPFEEILFAKREYLKQQKEAGELVDTAEEKEKWQPTTHIYASEFFPQRRAALAAHVSQVDPQGVFLACPLEIEQEVWPTEDYHLAASRVPYTSVETDLFAGLESIVGFEGQ